MIALAGAAMLVTTPTLAAAAPLRAGAALPAASTAGLAAANRAAMQGDHESALAGFPVIGFVALFVGIIVIVAVSTGGGGRSPG